MSARVEINIYKAVYCNSQGRVLKKGERNVLVFENECANWFKSGIAKLSAEDVEDESGEVEAPRDTPKKTRGRLARNEGGADVDRPADPVGER